MFDPVLSLTGGCKVSSLDPVADPGCPEGPLPPKPFAEPKAVAVDSYGNIYVSVNPEKTKEGRIDIFDSSGFYITELKVPKGPKSIAVDTEGNLYVLLVGPEGVGPNELVRYQPTPPYNPAAGELSYGEPTATVPGTKSAISGYTGIGINRKTNHLYVHKASVVAEYSSAKEGNELLDETIGKGDLSNPIGNAPGLAIDYVHKRIYASSSSVVKVFNLEAPHELLMTIKGSETPLGKEFAGFMSLAADEGTGHFFVYDGNGSNAVYEFSLAGEYLSTIEHSISHVFGAEITVDNGEHSPNGAENPFGGRYLYVPSHPGGIGHSFAFGPPKECPAKIEAASTGEITESEAELLATINPCGLETTYRIEYTSREAFELEGFNGATLSKEGTLAGGASPREVSVALQGLVPGSSYVFRVFAANAKGSAEAERAFATYPPNLLGPCPNDALRNAFSKLLPDCRAYELVTPPDTNGRNPLGVGFLGSAYFATLEASPDGNAASFEIEGGAIPGFEGTGSYAGDPYVSHRTEAGWGTEYAGPTGEESPALLPGSNSPDQNYVFWSTASGEGTAAIGGRVTTYIRYPDGHSELIGRGNIGIDPRAQGLLISENGGHIIFATKSGGGEEAVRLEENAPPEGTPAIYDRTIDPETGNEETHVVSLLPGNEIPKENQGAEYEGASFDGKAVAFNIGKTLYLRYNNEETYEIGEGLTFAGIAADGKRVFYLEGGDLFAYEVGGGENPIVFSSSSDVTPVNVASNGNAAYFVSPSVLAAGPNPAGDSPINGEQNLYRSEEGSIDFVGTVAERDVVGENPGNDRVDGLGLWTEAVDGRFGKDPSRATPDGSILLFEARTPLTDYDSEGHAEIYRYDLTGNELNCLSCNPTLAPAKSDASLQSPSQEQGAPEPGRSFILMQNLRADGRRVFFQSSEPLVLNDTDGLQDIYEWEAGGFGSCKHEGGCVYLISSGHSHRVEYLWAVSNSGDDVFFRSADLLSGIDPDATPSIYDARVEGGFAEPVEEEPCEGEGGCWHGVVPPPGLTSPGSSGPGPGNPPTPKSCPKGKHKAVHNGKPVCVKKHRHRKAGAKKKGAHR